MKSEERLLTWEVKSAFGGARAGSKARHVMAEVGDSATRQSRGKDDGMPFFVSKWFGTGSLRAHGVGLDW